MRSYVFVAEKWNKRGQVSQIPKWWSYHENCYNDNFVASILAMNAAAAHDDFSMLRYNTAVGCIWPAQNPRGETLFYFNKVSVPPLIIYYILIQ